MFRPMNASPPFTSLQSLTIECTDVPHPHLSISPRKSNPLNSPLTQRTSGRSIRQGHGLLPNGAENYFRTVLRSKTVIPGLDTALRTMKLGGIRQVIVPYGPLSYPPGDMSHDLVGPKPTTFSGMRALNFVLENPRVDRTLLFNVKLIRVDKGDGKGGFIRG